MRLLIYPPDLGAAELVLAAGDGCMVGCMKTESTVIPIGRTRFNDSGTA